ncbi:hypothetical protein DCAR_0207081 [Daucus carota subsp. sativus]|uniref:DDE Tnp4 domain-containing protein n=1 Tax=Daucus carota subsp. sativus TaxID=79200 RepID=A0AAF0WEW3_DAUCS|nr:hypothetical protein DCAR_0207081 [Daucus carota subsp. sativus]
MEFIYVLPGWEGSAHDVRVLRDAISRPYGLKVPKVKRYMPPRSFDDNKLYEEVDSDDDEGDEGDQSEYIHDIVVTDPWTNFRNQMAQNMFNEWRATHNRRNI